MLNVWPQEQNDGLFSIGQLYQRDNASLKADLWRAKPWMSIGRAVSQPLSLERVPYFFEDCLRLCFLVLQHIFLASVFCWVLASFFFTPLS